MYIYGCINLEERYSRVGGLRIAASAHGVTDYGTPTGPFAIPFPAESISKKFARFFATRTPTPPCVRMYIIHFARANIHQQAPLRRLRSQRKSSRQPRSDFRNFPNSGPNGAFRSTPDCGIVRPYA
jgi:hypothetical protein